MLFGRSVSLDASSASQYFLGARRRIADATAAKEAAEAKLLELESIDKDEFRPTASAVSRSLTGVGP